MQNLTAPVLTTKKQMVLEYLQRNGSITHFEAENYCRKCTRVAAVVHKLKSEGHDITTTIVPLNGDGGKGFARYFYRTSTTATA